MFSPTLPARGADKGLLIRGGYLSHAGSFTKPELVEGKPSKSTSRSLMGITPCQVLDPSLIINSTTNAIRTAVLSNNMLWLLQLYSLAFLTKAD